MAEKRYEWAGGAKLEEHSRRKHKILRQYVFDYLTVRCKLPQQERFRLAIVDGFAGGGRYQCGTAGSPLIFIKGLKPTAWEDYLSALEAVTPAIEAIAVTDYYVTKTYERILEYRAVGRLSLAKLVFPNVELRLDVATKKGGFVNLHLFVSPENPDHIAELRRFLSRLHFTVQGDRFDCKRADLIRLGKKADPKITEEGLSTAE